MSLNISLPSSTHLGFLSKLRLFVFSPIFLLDVSDFLLLGRLPLSRPQFPHVHHSYLQGSPDMPSLFLKSLQPILNNKNVAWGWIFTYIISFKKPRVYLGIITEISGFREVDDQSRATQRSHGVEQMPKLSSTRKSWDCKSKYGSKQHFPWVKVGNDVSKWWGDKALESMGPSFLSWQKWNYS